MRDGCCLSVYWLLCGCLIQRTLVCIMCLFAHCIMQLVTECDNVNRFIGFRMQELVPCWSAAAARQASKLLLGELVLLVCDDIKIVNKCITC